MAGRFQLIRVGSAEHARLASQILSPEVKLRQYRKVTSSVLKNALSVWADIWEELQRSTTSGVMALLEAENGEDGFKPSCGWPEFLEKMCLLRHYLDFAKGFSEKDKQ